MKKVFLSLALIAGLIAGPASAQASVLFVNGGHHGNHGHHNGGHKHGHHNNGHHNGNHGRTFPIPIPIPVPFPFPNPNPYPNPYPCTPGWDCQQRDTIRVVVWETEIVRDPFPRQVRYKRVVTARWDYRLNGYFYYNNHGQYVRVNVR